MFTFAEKLKQMSNIEHKDVGVSSLKGTPSKKIYIKTSTEAVYNPEGVTQEYINNHVDGSKIVDNTVTSLKLADNSVSTRTIQGGAVTEPKLADAAVSTRTIQNGAVTNQKIANGAVSMSKLNNEVQTLIQQGASTSLSPMGEFDIEAIYWVNDMVYDPVTNSSYVSLRADNVGHPVTDGTWWMKVLDGSYVNVMVDELEQAISQAIEDAQEDIDSAIADANAAAQAAWGVAYQAVDPSMDETSTNPVQNKVVTEAINNLSENLQELKGVVGVATEFSLVGNNNTGVSKILHLEAGRQYKLSTSMTAADYSNSSIQTGINVYSLTKCINSTSTNLFATFKGTDTVPSEFVFTAEEVDYYDITIRANSGSTIDLELRYYDSNPIIGKKDFSSVSVDTNEFGFYNYNSGFRIYFGRKQKLDCYKFPVRVVVTGVPSGVTCCVETYENYSDTLNPSATNVVENTYWDTTDHVLSNPLSNYLKLNFKSTASGINPKITNAQLASIKSDVRVSIISNIKLGGVHGENYDIAFEGGSIEEKIAELDSKSKMLDNVLTLDDFTCSWSTNSNASSGYTKTRYRCAIEVPKIPIYVKVENVPSDYIGSVNQSDSLANALSALVNPVDSTSWGILEHTFEEHNNALWIYLNFKKGSAGTAEFTQADMDAINQSVTVSIYPWIETGTANKTDIISLNDENRTLRYLRNLRRPNYSLDGRYTAGIVPFTLLHFSDLHSDKVNLKRLVEYKEHYAEYIDDAILTGDNIRNKFGDSFSFWSECGADSILLTTGNHEYYNGERSAYYTQITPLQVYNKFFAPYYQNWGTVVFPTDADVNGYNYYYKDYTAKKIRLIVLDNMANMKGERDGVQAAWLATVLESARTAGLHVICAIHIGSTIETRFNNPFTSEHAYINSDGGANAGTFAEFYTLREAVRTFIDNGGKFVVWIAGHRHVDTISVLTDDVRQGTIHVATASGGEFSSNAGGHGDTDATNNGHSWWIIPKGDDCDRTDDTKQQDCFNIYSVDTEKQLLRIFRVGSDVDRNGRHKGSLVYDYANRQVLYCD